MIYFLKHVSYEVAEIGEFGRPEDQIAVTGDVGQLLIICLSCDTHGHHVNVCHAVFGLGRLGGSLPALYIRFAVRQKYAYMMEREYSWY